MGETREDDEHPADLAIRTARGLAGSDARMLRLHLGVDRDGRMSLAAIARRFRTNTERARQMVGRARRRVRLATGAGEIDDTALDELIVAGHLREPRATGEAGPGLPRYPYADVAARLRAGRWPQRQDSTLDQLRDLAAVADALGCRDAADLMRRMAGEGAPR